MISEGQVCDYSDGWCRCKKALGHAGDCVCKNCGSRIWRRKPIPPSLDEAVGRVKSWPNQIFQLQGEVESLRVKLADCERKLAGRVTIAEELQRRHNAVGSLADTIVQLRDQLRLQTERAEYWRRNAEPSGELTNAVIVATRKLFGHRGNAFGFIHHENCKLRPGLRDCDCGAQEVRNALSNLARATSDAD